MSNYNYNGGESFLQAIAESSMYGVREGVKIFEEIFPTWAGVASIVGATDIYTFFDNSIDFDINDYLIPGSTAKIHFQTGNLAGYEFNLKRFDSGTGRFVISPARDSNNLEIPNANAAFKIATGDTYTILDITLPQAYIDAAERKLFQEVKNHLDNVSKLSVIYEVELDRIYLKNHPVDRGIIFEVGDTITLKDDDLSGGEIKLRILAVKRDVFNKDIISLTFANSSLKTLLSTISRRSKQTATIVSQTVFADPSRRRIANERLNSNEYDGGRIYG